MPSSLQPILVTGARGLLGSDLCPVLRRAGREAVAADLEEFDITDAAAVRAFVSACSPSLIINCAAYTAVDQAESDPETAFRVNRDGARNLAQAAAGIGAALLHISTDYVFDGAKAGAYLEEDLPSPLGVYGASKLAGELGVRETLEEHYIIRAAWLFGLHGKSFPGTILRLASEGKPLRVVNDQFGCPTYTVHLARILAKIIERPAYGLYHAVSGGACSWFEFARALLGEAGLEAELTPIPGSQFPTAARRPANSVLDTGKLTRTFGLQPPDWRQGVREFVAEWKSRKREPA